MTTQAIRIRTRLRDGMADVQVLMPHPMETGLRQDDTGHLVPAHYITEVAVTVGDRSVFGARLSIAVARDPLLSFRFRDAAAGQRLRVSWTDSAGATRVEEALLA